MVFSALNSDGKAAHHPNKVDTASKDSKGRNGSERILTIPNAITFVRMLLVPLVFVLIISGENKFLAFFLFALAGLTDFLDGFVARRTNSVTEFGKAIDPLVDRLLLGCGVLALFIVGKLPIWILAFVLSRDFFLLSGLAITRKITEVEIKIRTVGKWTTAVLLTGFAGLILGIGELPAGLGWTSSEAFPGFTAQPYLVWIWLIYLGLILSFVTLLTYIYDGARLIKNAKAQEGKVHNEA
jgi:cardiolipin synthase